ncbi:MAG TPA: GAF domain-containing protein [Polyangia bacterium]
MLPLIGWLVDHRDPFFQTRAFSWYVLPPLLAGLRHGFIAGCASAATLGASMVIGWRLHLFGGLVSPSEGFIGMFTIAMLTGHVSDVWLRETTRKRAAADHAKRRANEIARAHFLLQLSHERLQEQSPGIANLREALERIAGTAGPTATNWKAIAHQVLALAARFTSVEVASLVRIDARTDGRSGAGTTIGTLGDPSPLRPDDPLVRSAVRTRAIAAVAGPSAAASAAALRAPGASPLLAAVPIVDSGGVLHGVLCVEGMPFFAFTQRNLEALSILVGHFADRVASGSTLAEPHREREKVFLQRMDRALEDCRERGGRAVLGVLAVVGQSPLSGITDLLLSGILAPQYVIHRTRGRGGDTLIWLLLPDATEKDVRALVERIDDLSRQELERSLAEAGGTAAFRFLTATDQRVAVMGELERDLEVRRGRR